LPNIKIKKRGTFPFGNVPLTYIIESKKTAANPVITEIAIERVLYATPATKNIAIIRTLPINSNWLLLINTSLNTKAANNEITEPLRNLTLRKIQHRKKSG
jgi:hypothetical protein